MLNKIIHFSIKNKFIIGLFTLGLVVWGIYSAMRLPIDALPDITNNQVQIITTSPTLATQEIEKFIKEAMPDASVEIQDLAGDGNHYSATVTSSQFTGKSKIEQHKMVYNSLKGRMGNELHALAIKTKEQ